MTSAHWCRMTCPNCDADVGAATRSGEIFPRCRACGKALLPPDAETELEGFRARLAQLGLGEERLTMPNDRYA